MEHPPGHDPGTRDYKTLIFPIKLWVRSPYWIRTSECSSQSAMPFLLAKGLYNAQPFCNLGPLDFSSRGALSVVVRAAYNASYVSVRETACWWVIGELNSRHRDLVR